MVPKTTTGWRRASGLGGSRSEAAWAILEAAAEDQDQDVREIADYMLATWDFEIKN